MQAQDPMPNAVSKPHIRRDILVHSADYQIRRHSTGSGSHGQRHDQVERKNRKCHSWPKIWPERNATLARHA